LLCTGSGLPWTNSTTVRRTMGSPDQANRRVQYVRGEGFSAKIGDDRFTYTIRIAFWMLERWIQGADHAELDYTDEAREIGHGSKYRTTDLELCPRAETRQGDRVAYDYHEPGVYDANELGVRINHGYWDVERG